MSDAIQEFGLPIMAVEVINLSKFPVTLDEVGLCERTTKRERAPFFGAQDLNGVAIPIRLDARAAITLYSDEHALNYPTTSATRAYAVTSCDCTSFGASEALKAWSVARKSLD